MLSFILSISDINNKMQIGQELKTVTLIRNTMIIVKRYNETYKTIIITTFR